MNVVIRTQNGGAYGYTSRTQYAGGRWTVTMFRCSTDVAPVACGTGMTFSAALRLAALDAAHDAETRTAAEAGALQATR